MAIKPFISGNIFILDTQTTGNVILPSSDVNNYKLDETVILTTDRTYTLPTIEKEGVEYNMSFVDVDFAGKSVILQDQSGLMPVVTTTDPTTFRFRFNVQIGRWYRMM